MSDKTVSINDSIDDVSEVIDLDGSIIEPSLVGLPQNPNIQSSNVEIVEDVKFESQKKMESDIFNRHLRKKTMQRGVDENDKELMEKIKIKLLRE
jgi:hypothetical protein